MKRNPDRLAWLALLILDEAVEQAERGEILARSPALRLALAYLCSIADGPLFALPSRRAIFDTFWTEITTPATGKTKYMADYARSTYIAERRGALLLNTCKQQISRQLRFGENVFDIVRTARSPDAESRRRFTEMIRGNPPSRD